MEYVGKDKTINNCGRVWLVGVGASLVKVSKYLNPMHEENPPPLAPNTNDFLWGVVTFTKETHFFLVTLELSLLPCNIIS
jgi:hypothetical protein